MDRQTWSEILTAHREITGFITKAFASPAITPDLTGLQSLIRRRLNGLRVALEARVPPELAKDVLVPLVFLIDEQVLERLASLGAGREIGWTPLQRNAYPADDGGDVFFEDVARMLKDGAPALLFEVYLYCLHAGFEGRHAEDAIALADIRARLAEKVETPPLPAVAPSPPVVPNALSSRKIVLWTVAAVLAFNAVLFTVAAAMW